MVKQAAPAKLLPAKSFELFRKAKRPEITRLAESDPMPPPLANWSLGCGAGKAGRPTVTDLIKALAALRKELAEEYKQFEDFRRDETL